MRGLESPDCIPFPRIGEEPEEVAVFGDDVNDREMLAAYPRSVAMGNADPETRSLAAHVTGSNDEGAIAYALGEILRVLPRGVAV